MPLTFNAIPVAQTSHQKHLGLYLGEKLNFNHRIKEISKVNKDIIIKFRSILPRNALLLSRKLSYDQMINLRSYDQLYNERFCNNLEKLQYNPALAMTGGIKGTSKLKSLQIDSCKKLFL